MLQAPAWVAFSFMAIPARCQQRVILARRWRRSWDLKARGLKDDPQPAIGDGALGFWKALPQAFPRTRKQGCWVHKTAGVLDELPKGRQSKANGMLHDI